MNKKSLKLNNTKEGFNLFSKNIKKSIGVLSILAIFMTGCSNSNIESNQDNLNNPSTTVVEESNIDKDKDLSSENVKEENAAESSHNATPEENTEDIFAGYKLIEVDGGDLSGHREPNVVVDIGFGDREYWAFTNEYGQLVKVIAKEIVLQDESKEPVNSKGRYYNDEAKVPGVESKNLDEGHVIADSLGGVSNAYNITPQNSTLNRHGDQAHMEKVIRDAGGCTDFEAIITYPDTKTQIPSHYSYTYTINGNVIKDEFDNINPDEYNSDLESTSDSSNTSSKDNSTTAANSGGGTVYWTPSGKSYHTTRGCSTLSRSKTILSGTISESGKHDPCDRCH